MPEKLVVYPGTFDPVTFGHLDVIERAQKLFGRVLVAVATKPGKKPLFSVRERASLLADCTKAMPNVGVDSFSGLLVDYVKRKKVGVVLRGLRALSDFENEFQQATINRKLSPEFETIFVVTNPKYFYLNSSVVKEIASMNGKVDCFVPGSVERALRKKFSKRPGSI